MSAETAAGNVEEEPLLPGQSSPRLPRWAFLSQNFSFFEGVVLNQTLGLLLCESFLVALASPLIGLSVTRVFEQIICCREYPHHCPSENFCLSDPEVQDKLHDLLFFKIQLTKAMIGFFAQILWTWAWPHIDYLCQGRQLTLRSVLFMALLSSVVAELAIVITNHFNLKGSELPMWLIIVYPGLWLLGGGPWTHLAVGPMIIAGNQVSGGHQEERRTWIPFNLLRAVPLVGKFLGTVLAGKTMKDFDSLTCQWLGVIIYFTSMIPVFAMKLPRLEHLTSGRSADRPDASIMGLAALNAVSYAFLSLSTVDQFAVTHMSSTFSVPKNDAPYIMAVGEVGMLAAMVLLLITWPTLEITDSKPIAVLFLPLAIVGCSLLGVSPSLSSFKISLCIADAGAVYWSALEALLTDRCHSSWYFRFFSVQSLLSSIGYAISGPLAYGLYKLQSNGWPSGSMYFGVAGILSVTLIYLLAVWNRLEAISQEQSVAQTSTPSDESEGLVNVNGDVGPGDSSAASDLSTSGIHATHNVT